MKDNHIVPIVILGAGHSGTTILYNMLAMHPDLTWFSIFSQRWKISQCGFRNPITNKHFRIPLLNTYDKLLRNKFKKDWGKVFSIYKRFYMPRPIEADHIWDYLIPRDGSITKTESIRRIKRIFDDEYKLWQKKYLLIKVPRLFSHIDLIKKTFPGTRFIHIVRDGRAVAMSMRFKFMRYGESNEEGLYASSLYWMRALKSFHEAKHSIKALEVKYEDFCEDIHEYIKNILSFAGLKLDNFPFDKIPEALNITNYKWIQTMTKNEVKLCEKNQAKYLKEYGYSHN